MQTITNWHRKVATGVAAAHPLSPRPRFTVAADRKAAQPVAAPSSFDAAIDAIDAGAQRVEARPIR